MKIDLEYINGCPRVNNFAGSVDELKELMEIQFSRYKEFGKERNFLI